MRNKLIITGLACWCGIALGQTSTTNAGTDMSAATNNTTNSNTQKWVGLLVAMGCDTSSVNGGMNTATNISGSMATNTSPNTNQSMNGNSAMTGPDMNGSRGSGMNGTSNNMSGSATTAANQASAGSATPDQNFPKSTASAASESSGSMNTATAPANQTDTGNMNAATNSGNGQSGMDRAKTVASQMGPSCHIGANTSSFALRLPDGRLMPFDSASNAKIADQVRDRVSGNTTKIFRVVVTGTSDGNTITVDTMRI